MAALLSAYQWAEDLHEISDQLWVTIDVLMDRLDHLTQEEKDQLVALYVETERGC